MAVGEANGKSSTFTIKQQSATQTDCVGSLCLKWRNNNGHPSNTGTLPCPGMREYDQRVQAVAKATSP